MDRKLSKGIIIDRCSHTVMQVDYKGIISTTFNADWIPNGSEDWLSEIIYGILEQAYNAGKNDETDRIKRSLVVLKELLK